jgi:putative ABC transport system substrate-binding protein
VALTAVALLAPLAADAQQEETKRVGVLAVGRQPPTAEALARSPFSRKLEELGWVEGRNVTIERRYSESPEMLRALARDLGRLKVDVVVAAGGQAIGAAKQEITTIPVAILTMGDPVNAGFVTNIARPEGNLTGVAGFAPELGAKRLSLLKEAVPSLRRVAVLGNPKNPQLAGTVREIQNLTRDMAVDLRQVDVSSPAGIESAFSTMAQDRADGLLVISDGMIWAERRKVVELAARHRLPAIYEWGAFAQVGGLLTYGPDYDHMQRRLAVSVDRLLRGAKPRDLPVELPSKFEMVVNVKSAKALGLTIPPSVLLRADRIIE